jgi:hypothetical protein
MMALLLIFVATVAARLRLILTSILTSSRLMTMPSDWYSESRGSFVSPLSPQRCHAYHNHETETIQAETDSLTLMKTVASPIGITRTRFISETR